MCAPPFDARCAALPLIDRYEPVTHAADEAPPSHPRILFVEEEHDCVVEIAAELRRRGYRVCLADENGQDLSVSPYEGAVGGLDGPRATRLRAGDLEMDLIERTVKRGEAEIVLPPLAFKLLEYFLRRPGVVVTREKLLKEVWRYRFIPQTNVVDVHIGALRRKIDIAGRPSLIANIRGAGFILDLAPPTPSA